MGGNHCDAGPQNSSLRWQRIMSLCRSAALISDVKNDASLPLMACSGGADTAPSPLLYNMCSRLTSWLQPIPKNGSVGGF
jgi:hypothetical protein